MAKIKSSRDHEDPPEDDDEDLEEDEEEEDDEDDDEDDDTQDDEEDDDDEDDDDGKPAKKKKLTPTQRIKAENLMLKKEIVALKKKISTAAPGAATSKNDEGKSEDEKALSKKYRATSQALERAHEQLRDNQKLAAVQDWLADNGKAEFLVDASYIAPVVRVTVDDIDGDLYDPELLEAATEKACQRFIKLHPHKRSSRSEGGTRTGPSGTGGAARPSRGQSVVRKVSGAKSDADLLASYNIPETRLR